VAADNKGVRHEYEATIESIFAMFGIACLCNTSALRQTFALAAR
jgi:hypothetical protein